ncbi:MAG: energy transducer TonB [Betaproteobacteria bacterium]
MLILASTCVRADALPPHPVLVAQVDESMFRDRERIRPNWWQEPREDDRTSLSELTAALSREIRRNIAYPPYARRHHQQGTVHVAAGFDADGVLSITEILQSSGYRLLDEEALRAIAAIDSPIVPQELKGRRFNVMFPIKFTLEVAEPPTPGGPASP